jgi:hypothetical protein
MCTTVYMDLDRRKHDVDVLERVLGGIREPGPVDERIRIVDVDLPSTDDSPPPTLELTIGFDDSGPDRRRRGRS